MEAVFGITGDAIVLLSGAALLLVLGAAGATWRLREARRRREEARERLRERPDAA